MKQSGKYQKEHTYVYERTGQILRFPVATIVGKQLGPTIVIIAGVHGAECCGIAAAIALFKQLEPEEIVGEIIICICYNKGAFEQHKAFVVPEDNKSPFIGVQDKMTNQNTYSEYMTHVLFKEFLKDADYMVELHGGDIPEALTPFVLYPVTGIATIDEKCKQMAVAYGIPLVLGLATSVSDTPETKVTQSGFMIMAKNRVPSILAEAGQFGIYDENSVQTHMVGLRRVLGSIGILAQQPQEEIQQHFISYKGSLRSPEKGLWYPKKKVNDGIQLGEHIGTITNYFGEILSEIFAPFDGKIIAMRLALSIDKGNAMYYLSEYF